MLGRQSWDIVLTVIPPMKYIPLQAKRSQPLKKFFQIECLITFLTTTGSRDICAMIM
jgi:hypothetical protein